MKRRQYLAGGLVAALLAGGCSTVEQSMKYHEAEGVIAHLDQHQSVLQHAAAGSYTWSAVAPKPAKIELSIAGITNPDDQKALLHVLESKRFDERRDWNEIKVTFYEKTEFDATATNGVRYVNVLRTATVE